MRTPRSRASRACTSLRSSRSTWLLISSATPCRAAASMTASMSKAYAGALQDQPAGRMAEDVDVRVLDRAQQPIGHLLPVLRERGVHRGDDDVERGEAVVGEIDACRPAGCRTRCRPAAGRRAGRRRRGRARRARARGVSSSPLAIASAWLWSVMAMYSRPASRAASRHRRRACRGRRSRSCACAGRRAGRRGSTQARQASRCGAPRSRRDPRAAPAGSTSSPSAA